MGDWGQRVEEDKSRSVESLENTLQVSDLSSFPTTRSLACS